MEGGEESALDQGTMGELETEGQERRWVRLNTQNRMQRDLGVFEW